MVSNERRPDSGFALILALMALVLLTTLGLTLAATTSTELRIATNYRWNMQAYYNAQAGLEIGKRFLRDSEATALAVSTDGSWSHLLWPARDTAGLASPPDTSGFTSRPGPNGEASRNWEMQDCDTDATYGANVGLGWVVDDPTQPHPFQNVSEVLSRSLNGTFTIWLRRPLILQAGASNNDPATYIEDATNLSLILTAEGTAPFTQTETSDYAMVNRAVRYLEIQLNKTSSGNECDTRGGQVGGGAGGTGFDQCHTLSDSRETNTAIK